MMIFSICLTERGQTLDPFPCPALTAFHIFITGLGHCGRTYCEAGRGGETSKTLDTGEFPNCIGTDERFNSLSCWMISNIILF